MTSYGLTKTRMMQGSWEGLVTGTGEETPQIAVTHRGKTVEGTAFEPAKAQDGWLIRIPVPKEAIADGVQTLIITDMRTNEQIGNVTLLSGEALGDDMRAEIDLLREELDMLKRAFRRHCLETA